MGESEKEKKTVIFSLRRRRETRDRGGGRKKTLVALWQKRESHTVSVVFHFEDFSVSVPCSRCTAKDFFFLDLLF